MHGMKVLAVPVLGYRSNGIYRRIEIFFRYIVCPQNVSYVWVDTEVRAINQSVQKQC